MLRQMRLLYCRSNRLVRLFNACRKIVLLCYVTVCVQHFTVLIVGLEHKKATFPKLRVAYNNVYRNILGLCQQSIVSNMFMTNNISNFEALMTKSISNNTVICTIQRSLVIKETVWKAWTDKLHL